MRLFMSRSFWQELKIPNSIVKNKFVEYFGENNLELRSRKEAIHLLQSVIERLQEKMLTVYSERDSRELLKDLFKILDETMHFYKHQKEERMDLKKLNPFNVAITDTYEVNRNISRNVIEGVNIWIENLLLYQNITDSYDTKSFDVNCELMMEVYIYGVVSNSLSLLALSNKFDENTYYCGLDITPNDEIPIHPYRDNPVIFHSTLISGNQNALSDDNELKKANDTVFGEGFYKKYGMAFLNFLAVLYKIQNYDLEGGRIGLTVIDKEQFLQVVVDAGVSDVAPEAVFENFVLTKDCVESQLKIQDKLIWNIGVNENRFEIKPFVLLENGRVFISYTALEQALQLWVSYYSNGGMVYTNAKKGDTLVSAISRRNEELSKKLVNLFREKLRKKYKGDFDEIDVKYERIWGRRDINYGDYDLIFYDDELKELFLIEAKFFSDSLNASSMVADFNKLFEEDGYYDKCRRRYDLVLSEKEELKNYIGASGNINVHFLFATSKPLEVEFQDSDGVVSFVSVEIFDKYLDGNLISDEDDSVVRPTHVL